MFDSFKYFFQNLISSSSEDLLYAIYGFLWLILGLFVIHTVLFLARFFLLHDSPEKEINPDFIYDEVSLNDRSSGDSE